MNAHQRRILLRKELRRLWPKHLLDVKYKAVLRMQAQAQLRRMREVARII